MDEGVFMALEDFEELDSIVGDANIIIKTRYMLQEGREDLSERDRTILELAIDYLERLLRGRQFEEENRYVFNLIESVNTYDNTRPALDRLEVDNPYELVENSIKALRRILELGNVNRENINDAVINLFREIGGHLLHVSLSGRRERY